MHVALNADEKPNENSDVAGCDFLFSQQPDTMANYSFQFHRDSCSVSDSFLRYPSSPLCDCNTFATRPAKSHAFLAHLLKRCLLLDGASVPATLHPLWPGLVASEVSLGASLGNQVCPIANEKACCFYCSYQPTAAFTLFTI
jgi:hypothetical protein